MIAWSDVVFAVSVTIPKRRQGLSQYKFARLTFLMAHVLIKSITRRRAQDMNLGLRYFRDNFEEKLFYIKIKVYFRLRLYELNDFIFGGIFLNWTKIKSQILKNFLTGFENNVFEIFGVA